jgi:hypothetical protein
MSERDQSDIATLSWEELAKETILNLEGVVEEAQLALSCAKERLAQCRRSRDGV